MLEETVFDICKQDAKTREYRDKCNKLQMKLKVRFIYTTSTIFVVLFLKY